MVHTKKAIRSETGERIFGNHGGFRKLKAYRDYRKFLTRRGLRIWAMRQPEFEEARALRPETLDHAAAWVNAKGAQQSLEERAAYLGAILSAQAHWLTERLLDRQAQEFVNGGGFSERLYKARTSSR